MEQHHIHHAPVAKLDTSGFFNSVFGWMFVGLLLSGGMALYTSTSEPLLRLIFTNQLVFWGLLIFELALVFGLFGFAKSLPAPLVMGVFILYSIVTGLTLSIIFLIYEITSIVSIFFVTAGIFGLMALYGYTTKRDLTGMGSFLIMALIGVILAAVVNMFLHNSMLDTIISIIGVIIFVGLTAYDVQKIKRLYEENAHSPEMTSKIAVMGALNLYLDFINLFLNLLRLLGKRRQ